MDFVLAVAVELEVFLGVAAEAALDGGAEVFGLAVEVGLDACDGGEVAFGLAVEAELEAVVRACLGAGEEEWTV